MNYCWTHAFSFSLPIQAKKKKKEKGKGSEDVYSVFSPSLTSVTERRAVSRNAESTNTTVHITEGKKEGKRGV